MVVGVCRIELQLPGSASLKDKRSVLRSVITRLRNQFNVSVAEVDHQDSWNLATIGVACVANSAAYAHGMLEKVVTAVERERLGLVLLDYETELL